jgi:hypothetical protein
MGGSSSSSGPACIYKNQGERIDELNQRIRDYNTETRTNLDAVKTYINNTNANNSAVLKSAQDTYNALKDKYSREYSGYDDQISGLQQTVQSLNSEITALQDNIVVVKKNINSTQDSINQTNGVINQKNNDINVSYNNINTSITASIFANEQIDMNKNEIFAKSNSIAYFENLMLLAYKEVYDAVGLENKALRDNRDMRSDNYSIDQSAFVYQSGRTNFYKNINTFLFYLYYIFVIVLVIVILKFNDNNMLTKLTLFRLFVVLLILYPLFISRFQQFIYDLLRMVYDRLKTLAQ